MKCKIFFCSGNVCDKHADEKFNEWIKEHPQITITNVQYQQNGNGHSIAVFYKERRIRNDN